MELSAVFKIVLIGVSVLLGAFISVFAPRKYHDTKVEEAAEKVIHVVTGVDIDLTPNSPEPEDFVETDSYPQEEVFEDNWDKYFDEYNRVKELVQHEVSFPLEKIITPS